MSLFGGSRCLCLVPVGSGTRRITTSKTNKYADNSVRVNFRCSVMSGATSDDSSGPGCTMDRLRATISLPTGRVGENGFCACAFAVSLGRVGMDTTGIGS